MELTLGVSAGNGDRGPGRLLIRADDPSLTPYAGLAISGELARRLRLVELVDAELGAVRRARAVKARRRGLSPGALVVSLAECQLAGAECFDDLEALRADRAGAPFRAVADTRYRRCARARPRSARRKGRHRRVRSRQSPPTHAWFIAYRGDLAIAVLVEGGRSGGSVAAPITARFFQALDHAAR